MASPGSNECILYAYLEGIGAGVMGLADVSDTDNDTATLTSGTTLIVVSMIIVIYAIRTFFFRARMMNERTNEGFAVGANFFRHLLTQNALIFATSFDQDETGPICLGFITILAMLIVLFFMLIKKYPTAKI
jgi:hypothetical protein